MTDVRQPLHVTSDNPWRLVEYAENGDMIQVIEDADGMILAILDGDARVPIEHVKGNGLLMAAAPDMRRALGMLLGSSRDPDQEVRTQAALRALKACCAALGKANGYDPEMFQTVGERHDGSSAQ